MKVLTLLLSLAAVTTFASDTAPLNDFSNCDLDADGDGFDECVDCNDADPENYPGNVDYCDGRDNDCDGLIDDNPWCARACPLPQWYEGESAEPFTQLAWTGSGYGAVESSCGEGGWCWLLFFVMDRDGNPTTPTIGIDQGYHLNTDPAIVWNGSEFAVTWTSYADSLSPRLVNFARLSAAGTQIGSNTIVATGEIEAAWPTITWSGSEYGIPWIEYEEVLYEGPTYRIRFTRVDRAGQPIATTQLTPDLTSAFRYPETIRDLALAWSGTEFGLAWSDSREGNYEIHFARVDAAGAIAGEIQRVTNAEGRSVHPALLWTGLGYGLAWSDDRDGHDAIYFTELDVAGVPATQSRLIAGFGAPRLAWTGVEYGLGWDNHFARLIPPAMLLDTIAAPTATSIGWTGRDFGLSTGAYLDRISCTCDDVDEDDFSTCAGDCDDENADVYPVAGELCDGIDNDCDGTIDEPGACDPGPFQAPPLGLYTDGSLGTTGLVGSYVDQNLWWYDMQDDWRVSQTIAGTRVDEVIDFTGNSWGLRSEVGLTGGSDADWDEFSVQWDGFVEISVSGTRLATVTDDSSRMWIDLNHDGVFAASGDELLDNNWGNAQGVTEGPRSVALSQGVYRIRIQYQEGIYANWAQLITVKPEIVRVAYIVPSNRTPQPQAVERIRHSFGMIHEFYREQMERNGFGSRSFRYEVAGDGVTPIVHTVPVAQTDEYLRTNVWNRVISAAAAAGVSTWHNGEIWFLVPETHLMQPDGTIIGTAYLGAGFGSGSGGGVAMVSADTLALMTTDALNDDTPYDGRIVPGIGPYPLVQDVSFPWFVGTTTSSLVSSTVGGMAHELGHSLGLYHDFRNDMNFHGNLMGNGLRGFRGVYHPDSYVQDDCRLAYSQALAMSTSRYFVETPPLFSPGPPVLAENPEWPAAASANPGTARAAAGDVTRPTLDCFERTPASLLPARRDVDDAAPTVTIATSGAVTPENGRLILGFTASDDVQLASAFLQKEGDRVAEMALDATSISTSFATPYYDPGVDTTYEVLAYDQAGNRYGASTVIQPQGTGNRGPRPFLLLRRSVAAVGAPVTFDAIGTSDPDSGGLSFECDFHGDGIYDTAPTTEPTATTFYTAEGLYPVRLRVTDPAGSQIESTRIPLRILCAPGTAMTWHLDLDGDGRGDSDTDLVACAQPYGYASAADDCDDLHAAVYPGAPQVCDALNNDCDHPAYPALHGTTEFDDDGDGYSECAGDCNDGTALVYPAAPEFCDAQDNDCDGVTDEGVPVAGEVLDVQFEDGDSLRWSQLEGRFPYALYRGTLNPSGFTYDHHCLQWDLVDPAASDSERPAYGFYYLISGRDACGEGTLGTTSDGSPRPNPGDCG